MLKLKKSLSRLGIFRMTTFSFPDKNYFGLLIIACLALLSLTSTSGLWADMRWWAEWTTSINTSGVSRIYDIPDYSNYFPLSLYIISFLGNILISMGIEILDNAYYFKYMFFIFDFLSIILVYKILKFYKTDIYKSFLILFNVAFFYNTLIWGQLDSIYTFALLLSVYSFLKDKKVFGALFCLIALNLKLQAIATIPIIAVFFVKRYLNKKDLPIMMIALVYLQFLIFSPFIIYDKLPELKQMILRLPETYTEISLSAYNYWLLGFGSELVKRSDDLILSFGITAKLWGMGIFGVCTLLIVGLIAYFRLYKKIWKTEIIFLLIALINLCFFFFTTRMHERYIHQAIIFAGIWAILSRRYLFYILISIAYVLNLNHVLGFWQIQKMFPLLDSQRNIAVVFALALLAGFVEICLYSIKRIEEGKSIDDITP